MSEALGREINEFYTNYYPPHCYLSEMEDWVLKYIQKDGSLTLPDDGLFDIEDFGIFVNEDTEESKSFSSLFKKWRTS
jgi:hypothetical protein